MPVSYAIECLLSSDPEERKEMLAYIRSTDTLSKTEAILNENRMEVNHNDAEKDRAA